MSEKVVFIFTSGNTIVSANNNPLGFVQAVDVEDLIDESGEKYSQIILHRIVNGNEDIINDMRLGTFLFKIFNSETGGGYIASDAELIGFKMHLSTKKDMNPVDLLEQTLIVKAKSFLYIADARSKEMKQIEEEDSANLIKIIKEHQARYSNKVVIPSKESPKDVLDELSSDDLVWLNAKDPAQLSDLKPRKLKKDKK